LSRFEVTMSDGEKLIVEHAAETPEALVEELARHSFLTCGEIKPSGSAAHRDVILAASQISLIRPLLEGSSQGSNFRPKR
jgi:hypothetical protein